MRSSRSEISAERKCVIMKIICIYVHNTFICLYMRIYTCVCVCVCVCLCVCQVSVHDSFEENQEVVTRRHRTKILLHD